MYRKAAIYAGNLGRAQAVFGLGREMRDYLPTLVPLLEHTPETVLDNLPPYYQRFGRAIRSFDFDRALYLFENKHKLTDTFPRMNKTANPARTRVLAMELEELYSSRSWRITAPLRKAVRLYRKLARKAA
jgi:hypothetical protein